MNTKNKQLSTNEFERATKLKIIEDFFLRGLNNIKITQSLLDDKNYIKVYQKTDFKKNIDHGSLRKMVSPSLKSSMMDPMSFTLLNGDQPHVRTDFGLIKFENQMYLKVNPQYRTMRIESQCKSEKNSPYLTDPSIYRNYILYGNIFVNYPHVAPSTYSIDHMSRVVGADLMVYVDHTIGKLYDAINHMKDTGGRSLKNLQTFVYKL